MANVIQAVKDAIECAGFEPREDYSGRGMYGSQCLSFTVDDESAIVAVARVVSEAYEDSPEAGGIVAHAFEKAQSDSMGMGAVIYFPRLTVAAPTEKVG